MLTGPGSVGVHGEQGLITGFTEGLGDADTVLPHGVLTPGMIDLQLNGAFGHDFVAADSAAWREVAAKLPATGVTGFCPTFITGDFDTLTTALVRAGELRAKFEREPIARDLGVHLEGPFLSPARAGTHPPRHLREPTPELVGRLLDDAAVRDALAMITLAPELPGAIEAIGRIVATGIRVSAGHTDATAAEMSAAADAGATMVTHLFNAQRGLGHREPGVVGAALSDPRLTPGLIADLHHVVGPICTLVLRVAGERTALVSDAMAAAGMAPGRYRLGDVDVTLVEGDVPRNPDGTIAGSALTLDLAVRNLVGIGNDPAMVLTSATRVPADALGRTDLGRIAPGARADLVWWSDDWTVRKTWIGGVVAYEAA